MHPAQTAQELQAEIETLRPIVDAIQIGDNEKAEGHIAPLAAASLVLGCDVDPIIHLSCRDRNRIALQSEVLGAAAIGATSLLLKRGNKLPSSFRGRVKSVFDTKATQLLATAARVRESSRMESAKNLFFGAHVTIIGAGEDWQAEGVIEKIDSGAGFLQTRPCLDESLLGTYVARLVSLKIPHRATLIVGAPLITSPAEARSLMERYPDIKIPNTVMERLAQAGNARSEGINILAGFLEVLFEIPGVGGAAIYYERDVEAVVEAVNRARSGTAHNDVG